MLLVLSKEKIISVVIAFSTVAILFALALWETTEEESIETANTMRQVPIYSVDTRGK